MNIFPSAVHASSTIESGAPRIDCLALFVYPPPLNLIRSPMNSLPSAVHVSSVIKRGASGDWEIWFFVIYPISSFAKHVYMCILCYQCFLLFVFVLCCAEKEEGATRVVID